MKQIDNSIQVLRERIAQLENELEKSQLLQDIWYELGPYNSALSNDLRHRLQDYFQFDDSE